MSEMNGNPHEYKREYASPARNYNRDFGMTSVFMDIADPAIIKDRITDMLERYPGEQDLKAYLALWEWRYNKKKRGQGEIYADRMMEFFNILFHHARLSKGYFAKKRAYKELSKFLKDSQLEAAISAFKNPEEAWYNLFYVTAVRHIKLCMSDRLYTSVAFGMGTLKNSDGAMRMANDTFDTKLYYPCLIGLDEEYPAFIRAIYHAYLDEFPEFHLYINNNIDKAPDPRIRQVIKRIIENA